MLVASGEIPGRPLWDSPVSVATESQRCLPVGLVRISGLRQRRPGEVIERQIPTALDALRIDHVVEQDELEAVAPVAEQREEVLVPVTGTWCLAVTCSGTAAVWCN